jgi:sec-independent protein translocase protein TatA
MAKVPLPGVTIALGKAMAGTPASTQHQPPPSDGEEGKHMFGRLGAPEIILILVVIILLFGAKKLPDMARSLGKSARILKSEAKAMKKDKDGGAGGDGGDGDDKQSDQRTIQAAPGDVSSSRPVNEPERETRTHG